MNETERKNMQHANTDTQTNGREASKENMRTFTNSFIQTHAHGRKNTESARI